MTTPLIIWGTAFIIYAIFWLWYVDDKITDFKVMVKPLKAVNLNHQKMGDMLMKMKKS